MTSYGPSHPVSAQTHAEKYRSSSESFYEAMCRIAATLSDTEEHRRALKDILLDMRFMPAGRIQAAVGSPKTVTPYNCFVSGTIEDSMQGIMLRAGEAAETMRMGGGDGYDFSTIRPRNSRIVSLDSRASGPLSFMEIYDSVCSTVASAGNRRGAQMGVLRVDHPDIEEFIHAKQNSHRLTNFNLSVAVTDEFMEAVEAGGTFNLRHGDQVYKTVDARALWEEIMRSTWDWAEPGVLFIDTINRMNNLHYCETIAATNPCAEQPLPPNGACLLGSFNLVKYVEPLDNQEDLFENKYQFNWERFKHDIYPVVVAMDNVIDVAVYPLPAQAEEAKSKRRMGLGITGLANAGEAVTGQPYGSKAFLQFTEEVMAVLRDTAYRSSISLACEKGPFPLFDANAFTRSQFVNTLPSNLIYDIKKYGIRNSHLISIAPTGTISLCADNVSSGIEPVFALSQKRTIKFDEGDQEVILNDYGLEHFHVAGKTADECSVDDHVNVLLAVQPYVDSAVSKTCNVGDEVSWDEFKEIYQAAYRGGAKGATTFRANGKRGGILKKLDSGENLGNDDDGAACYVDFETGIKTCE